MAHQLQIMRVGLVNCLKSAPYNQNIKGEFLPVASSNDQFSTCKAVVADRNSL
jgi:hypothetical protein